MNTKDGSSEMQELPIATQGDEQTVFFHDDPSVDLAVFPITLDQTRYDALPMSQNMLLDRDGLSKNEITEGTDVFFTGLFAAYPGNKRNVPITRFGKLALVPEEPIQFADRSAMFYLMEAQSYGGNSGSPVFFYAGLERVPGALTMGEPFLKLAGVVSGRFNETLPVQGIQTGVTSVVSPNIGIMAVVPSYQLREILFGMRLLEMRRKAAAKQPPGA